MTIKVRAVSSALIASHVPYKVSDEFRDEVAIRQRRKGAVKYPKLFDPDDWSDDALAEHAMMEFHDGQEYVSGMRTRMRQLRMVIEDKDREINELRLLLSAYMKGEEQYGQNRSSII